MKEKNTFKEYSEFISSSAEVPTDLTQNILKKIESDLNPSISSVLISVLLMHFIIGSLTLIICPQFGIGPLGGGQGIVAYVETFGPVACGAFCGGFFFAGSLVLMNFVLSRPQKKVLYSHRYGMVLFLVSLSLATLLFIGSMLNGHIHHLHLEFVLVWVGSAILLSLFVMEKMGRRITT